MPKNFEDVGWSRIDISSSAQERIEHVLKGTGIEVRSIDLTGLITGFQTFKCLREYEGEYKAYAGPFEHCFLEKCLEHYLSLLFINPAPEMVGVDVGSCQSVLPGLGRRVYGIRFFEQDLEYPSGVQGDRIGSSAESIPLPDHSVDFMTLHCTFEHFESDGDKGFIRECARLLKRGGKAIILPIYLSEVYCNVTGEVEAENRAKIGFDSAAEYYCLIPEWKNRFGRHYSPRAFMERVWDPAVSCGLRPRLYKVANWHLIHENLWLRWAMVLEQSFCERENSLGLPDRRD